MNETYPIYRSPPSTKSLGQGDILDPGVLRENLLGHQDYFLDKPHFYRYMVLTQTCDLDRSRETADYIFLAVIRRLTDALGLRQVENKRARSKTETLLRDLYNHNYNKRGFFYLPVGNNYGIEVESVVDLRVMFSLHKVHYPDLLRARLGAITDLYAAQLGHMAGYMFSRIATPGWQELNPDAELSKHTSSLITSIQEREKATLAQLLERIGNKCSVQDCPRAPTTYRWASSRQDSLQVQLTECPLCDDHAKSFDDVDQ